MSIIKAFITMVITIAVSYVALVAMGVPGAGYMAMMAATTLPQAIAIGAIAGFAGGAVGALLSGASPGEALVAGLTGAVIGAISAGAARMIGDTWGHTGNYLQRGIAHGIVRGILARVQGGNFSRGFMSAFASVQFGRFSQALRDTGNAVKAAFHALVGGTVSLISGGKFGNGAVSAAVVYLFNDIGKVAYHAEKTLGVKDKAKGWLESIKKLDIGVELNKSFSEGQANFRNWLKHNPDSPHYMEVLQMQAKYERAMNYVITYYAIHGIIPIRRKDGSWKY